MANDTFNNDVTANVLREPVSSPERAEKAPTSPQITTTPAPTREAESSGEVKQKSEPSTAAVDSAVSELNTYVQDVRRELEFRVEEDSGKTVITVLDHNSEEVIRQIPSEEAVRMARFLKELQSTDDAAQATIMNGLILELRA